MPRSRQSWCRGGVVLDGRDELVEMLFPKLMALGFREVGMSNQKCFAVGGHGPGEQLFIVVDWM
jgi:hypothetical protein